MSLLQQMAARAQANPQRIVLPEGDEIRTLKAANQILADG
ncbi:MAG: phosphate acyltransferase, partial [Bacteroidales bacterium]